jgi:hypothetical protein
MGIFLESHTIAKEKLEEKRKELNSFIDNNIKSPEDLLDFMKDFKYGYYANGRFFYDEKIEVDYGSYRLMQPEEVFSKKIGVCQDQALFELYVLRRIGFRCKMYFIHQYYANTHTFLTFIKDGKWFYFENSFAKYRGIRGPFNSCDEIIFLVQRQMMKTKFSKDGFFVRVQDHNDILNKYDMSIEEYLEISGFDFKRG